MTEPKIRDRTIDVARGIAIIAIVFGHVQRGLVRADLLDGDSTYFQISDLALYLVHLSVFAFLSGLFVASALDRAGTGRFLRRRLGLFAYLYILWSLLQGSVAVVLSTLVNRPRSWTDVLTLWIPIDQFWFLPWLMVMTIIAVVVRPWQSRPRALLGVVGALLLSLALWGWNGPVVGTQGLGLTILFVLGATLRADRMKAALDRIPAAALGLGGLVLAAAFAVIVAIAHVTPPTEDADDRTVASVALGFFCAFAGSAVVIVVSRLLDRLEPVGRFLAMIGRRSLEIFMAHILATAGTRILLERVGIDDPIVQLVAGTVVGVAAPLALWWVLERIRVPWLFRPPRWVTGAPDQRRVSKPPLHTGG